MSEETGIKDSLEAIVKAAYERGFVDGLACFAFMKDGVTYVGTTGHTLKSAVENRNTLWNFKP